jgi:hypothetical protein
MSDSSFSMDPYSYRRMGPDEVHPNILRHEPSQDTPSLGYGQHSQQDYAEDAVSQYSEINADEHIQVPPTSPNSSDSLSSAPQLFDEQQHPNPQCHEQHLLTPEYLQNIPSPTPHSHDPTPRPQELSSSRVGTQGGGWAPAVKVVMDGLVRPIADHLATPMGPLARNLACGMVGAVTAGTIRYLNSPKTPSSKPTPVPPHLQTQAPQFPPQFHPQIHPQFHPPPPPPHLPSQIHPSQQPNYPSQELPPYTYQSPSPQNNIPSDHYHNPNHNQPQGSFFPQFAGEPYPFSSNPTPFSSTYVGNPPAFNPYSTPFPSAPQEQNIHFDPNPYRVINGPVEHSSVHHSSNNRGSAYRSIHSESHDSNSVHLHSHKSSRSSHLGGDLLEAARHNPNLPNYHPIANQTSAPFEDPLSAQAQLQTQFNVAVTNHSLLQAKFDEEQAHMAKLHAHNLAQQELLSKQTQLTQQQEQASLQAMNDLRTQYQADLAAERLKHQVVTDQLQEQNVQLSQHTSYLVNQTHELSTSNVELRQTIETLEVQQSEKATVRTQTTTRQPHISPRRRSRPGSVTSSRVSLRSLGVEEVENLITKSVEKQLDTFMNKIQTLMQPQTLLTPAAVPTNPPLPAPAQSIQSVQPLGHPLLGLRIPRLFPPLAIKLHNNHSPKPCSPQITYRIVYPLSLRENILPQLNCPQ